MRVQAVKVVVRVRPLCEDEENCVEVENGRIRVRSQCFDFESVIQGKEKHDELWRETNLISNLFEGYNATVLAYGQTGSGKTYSMGSMGGDGVVPRAVEAVFANPDEDSKVFLSLCEVYNEECRDLLMDSGEKLFVRNSTIVGLSERLVSTQKEVFDLLAKGSSTRSTACTEMNSHSSRSHMIATLRIEVLRGPVKTVAKLQLVDLAGSERAKRTGACGERLREGIGINKSLLALGQVIASLEEGEKHVPYRDSTLTKILADSLGGTAIAVMVACVSPSGKDADETANTLRWASRALKIKNNAVTNIVVQDETKQLRQRVVALAAENAELRARLDALRFALTPEAAAVAEGVVDDMKQQREEEEVSCSSEEDDEEEAAAENQLKSLRMEGECMEKLRMHYESAISKLEYEVSQLEKERETLLAKKTGLEPEKRLFREKARELEKKAARLRLEAEKATSEARRCSEVKARAESESARLKDEVDAMRKRRGELQKLLQSKDAQHATAAKEWRREARRLRRDRDRLSGEKKKQEDAFALKERTRLRQLEETRAAVRKLKKSDEDELSKARAHARMLQAKLDAIRPPSANDHNNVIQEYAARCSRIRRASVDVEDLDAKMNAVKSVIADVRSQRANNEDPRLLRDVVARNYQKPWQHNASLPPPPPIQEEGREPLAEIFS